MKIRIIGGIGSGKTYLAKKLAKKFTLSLQPLDDVVWDNDADEYMKENTAKKRDSLLKSMLKKKRWVIEGVYYEPWVKPTIVQADYFIYLDVPRIKRYYRVIKRFILAKLGRGFAYEKNLKEVYIILKLDTGWRKGICHAGKKALRFTSADKAYGYLLQHRD